LVKKTALSAYSRPRRGGIIAMNILDDDCLIKAAISNGSNEIVLATQKGQAVRFIESAVRPTGRGTQGVKGVTLANSDVVVGMVIVEQEGSVLTVCSNGYGKRTQISDYRLTNRGGKGVINIKTTDRNGEVVSVNEVTDEDELMIISQKGILIRLPIRDLGVIGRNTQGVKLINLEESDRVIDVARVAVQDEVELENWTVEGSLGEAGDSGESVS